jgi:hypothetical protein
MSTQEFYIRGENDTEARGPFSMDQLSSLAEAGQVTADTLYYDAATEQWVTVGSNQALLATLFPEKKRLKVKPKNKVETINVQRESDAPITVHEMLAAAEGKTAETAGRGDPRVMFERVAGWGCRALTLMMAASTVAFIAPNLEPVYALDLLAIATSPFILFGLFDLFLTILLILQVTSIYPMVRFRALLGFGFFGLLYYLWGEPTLLLAVAAGSVGAYLTTIALNWGLLTISALVGVAGMVGYAWLVLA